MFRACNHVRSTAQSLRASCRGPPYRFSVFDPEEVASLKEWADDASHRMQQGMVEEYCPSRERMKFYIGECIAILGTIQSMPPTVDTIDAQERMRATILRLKEALQCARL